MRNVLRLGFFIVPIAVWVAGVPQVIAEEAAGEVELVQAEVVLTVSEGKRLIARAVAQMPILRQALENGTVIIAKGTTNTYVAEEILGEDIAPGAYVIGATLPSRAERRPPPAERMTELVFGKGEPPFLE
jgi:hypothetical protein